MPHKSHPFPSLLQPHPFLPAHQAKASFSCGRNNIKYNSINLKSSHVEIHCKNIGEIILEDDNLKFFHQQNAMFDRSSIATSSIASSPSSASPELEKIRLSQLLQQAMHSSSLNNSVTKKMPTTADKPATSSPLLDVLRGDLDFIHYSSSRIRPARVNERCDHSLTLFGTTNGNERHQTGQLVTANDLTAPTSSKNHTNKGISDIVISRKGDNLAADHCGVSSFSPPPMKKRLISEQNGSSYMLNCSTDDDTTTIDRHHRTVNTAAQNSHLTINKEKWNKRQLSPVELTEEPRGRCSSHGSILETVLRAKTNGSETKEENRSRAMTMPSIVDSSYSFADVGNPMRKDVVCLAEMSKRHTQVRVASWMQSMVRWAASQMEFCSLPDCDRRNLLHCSWTRMLLLYMTDSNFQFNVSALKNDANGNKEPGTVRKNANMNFVESVRNFIRAGQNLGLDETERNLMKLMILYNPSEFIHISI